MKKTLILTAAAIPTGVIVGAVDALFGRVLLYLGAVRDAHTAWLLPFLGVVGALMAWAYKKYGAGCENGMGMVFEAGHADREDIPLQLVPFVMCATWLTHLFGGSAGREGVAVQLGAAISHRVGRLLRVEDAPRLMLITGISAGFAGLFRTPFAATAFAMEVLTVGRLEHRALLPAAVAALCASATSGALGLEKFEFAVAAPAEWDALLLAKLAALGVIFGLVGAAFAFCLRNAKKMAQNRLKNPVLRAFCMGLALSVVLYALYRGRYCGLGTNLINASLSGETVYAWDWALKLALTVLTLAAGFQGVDAAGDITTLGRGGSDTTAVALAAFLHADLCRIYTDVDGVYDRDPRLHPDAVKYGRISYDDMLLLARGGARVLHDRCVELARREHVVLEVCSAFSDAPGTIVG